MTVFLRAVLTGCAALVVVAGPSPSSSTFSPSPSPSPSPSASSPAPTAVAVGDRTRPRAYARPYIQRVWLPTVRDPAGFRANHSQSIRNFALAINDTATFLRFLKEEEQRLGLRLGTDEETFRDAEVGDGEGEGETSLADAASAFASAANAASASGTSAGSSVSGSAEGSEYEYDNSLSADRERTVPPTTTTASPPPPPPPSTTSAPWVLLDRREGRQPRAHWFRPRPSSDEGDDDDATPATALPFVAYTSTLRSAAGFYRGLAAAPSETRNRTTPYTVTPVASFHGPNATFVYETYAHRYGSSAPSPPGGRPDEERVAGASDENPGAESNKVSLSDEASASRADSLPEAEALVAESHSQAEQSQYAAYADADRRLRNGVSSSSQDLSDASYFSISNEGPETEEVGGDGASSAYAAYPAVEYRDVRRPDSGHAGPYDFGARDVDAGGDASATEFRNRPMVPMAGVPAYNLQTAPRRTNRSRQHDPMLMSPSTIAPHVVEVFSVSPVTYYLSSSVQPPFDNGTEPPAEYRQAPSFNHLVESPGGYSEYRSANEVKAQRKHSARYQSAAVAASYPLNSYNPFSIFPKYRATFVPRKEHSVKVLSGNPSPVPPAAPSPTVISYIEEPFAQLEERRTLAESRGASGNLAPTDSPPSSSSSTDASAASADDSTVQQSSVTAATATASYALPAAAYYSRVGGRAHGRAGPHGLSARARRPKARRRHRKSHRHPHNHRVRARGRSRAAAHFGVARMLLPPPVSRKVARLAVGVTVAPRVPETWQWQEGLMQPDEHFNDAAADSFTQQPPHHHHHNHPAPTHAPTFSPTYSSSSSVSSPAYTPTSSPTYAPTYSPTYSSTAFAPTVTVSPPPPPSPTHLLPTQASPSPLAAGAEREGRGKAGRRALRTPKHPRHRAGPNALDGLLASEETQYRRRVKEKMALGHFRPEGIGEHGSIPGEPGVDYPTYSKPPVPSFSCLDFKGRRGYVADPSTRCQVFYICPGDGRGKAMLCPNGTVFNQDVSVCDWWFNVKCSGP